MQSKKIVSKWNDNNSNKLNRTLLESIIVPEIRTAISNWIKSTNSTGVLIGGIALSYHAIPRYTSDVDILYLTDNDIPNYITGFKKIRSHAFRHDQTHVEIEVLSSDFLKLPVEFSELVIDTAIESDGMLIADKAAIAALKLGRANRRDQADIEELIESGNVDITPYENWLSLEQIKLYTGIKEETV